VRDSPPPQRSRDSMGGSGRNWGGDREEAEATRRRRGRAEGGGRDGGGKSA
jgi:hypothetical protein